MANAAPADAWEEARQLAPGAILVRHLNPAEGTQFFLKIERSKRNVDKGADLYDGSTVIFPGGFTPGEHEEIIAAADRQWAWVKKV